MDANEMSGYISATFDGVNVLEGYGDLFFLFDPDRDLPPERQQPFATIVTGDHYDNVSKLDRPGAYRLNIGLTKAGYVERFGPVPTRRGADDVFETGFDYSAVDTLMPHPTYAPQYWVCAVNPALGTVRELLAEAYAFAVRKHANHAARQQRPG